MRRRISLQLSAGLSQVAPEFSSAASPSSSCGPPPPSHSRERQACAVKRQNVGRFRPRQGREPVSALPHGVRHNLAILKYRVRSGFRFNCRPRAPMYPALLRGSNCWESVRVATAAAQRLITCGELVGVSEPRASSQTESSLGGESVRNSTLCRAEIYSWPCMILGRTSEFPRPVNIAEKTTQTDFSISHFVPASVLGSQIPKSLPEPLFSFSFL